MRSAMFSAISCVVWFAFELNIVLYRPMCRPEGDVVVVLRQCLNNPLNFDVVIVVKVSGHKRLQFFSTYCKVESSVVASTLQVPSRMESASGESAAQFRDLIDPIVKGVPAHWLKWR